MEPVSHRLTQLAHVWTLQSPLSTPILVTAILSPQQQQQALEHKPASVSSALSNMVWLTTLAMHLLPVWSLLLSLFHPNAASSAPGPLQVTDVGAHSALLLWESPSHPNGFITSYHIKYQCSLPDELITYKANTSSSETSFLLSGLVPLTSYTTSVAAVNGAGVGMFSQESAFTTAVPSESVCTVPHFCKSYTNLIQGMYVCCSCVHCSLCSRSSGRPNGVCGSCRLCLCGIADVGTSFDV